MVWRYQVADEEFTAVVLPFGGALGLVVLDGSVADAYIGDDPGDLIQNVTPQGVPKSADCTFGY